MPSFAKARLDKSRLKQVKKSGRPILRAFDLEGCI